jgi:protein-S-isoprenylcysteine O-methyltransferase Ste14
MSLHSFSLVRPSAFAPLPRLNLHVPTLFHTTFLSLNAVPVSLRWSLLCSWAPLISVIDFQQAKAAYLKTAKVPADTEYTQVDLDRGFVISGLWSWCRHPNFAAEQAVWLALYQWGTFASDSIVNWTLAGGFGYLMLFQGSTRFTEGITAGKYSEYKEYRKLVGMFLPSMLGSTFRRKGKAAVKKH